MSVTMAAIFWVISIVVPPLVGDMAVPGMKDEKFLEAVKKLVELHLKEEQRKKRQVDTSETS